MSVERSRRAWVVWLVVALTSGGCALLRPPPRLVSSAPVADDEEPLDPSEGLHLRLMTDRGPVHVYKPRGYEPASAATLLYVHGYYTDLDGAFRRQHLGTQFGNSNVNALFISPEAPTEYTEAVKWPNLKELLELVQESGVKLPKGAVVAMAHSGGFRTLVPWLKSGLLDTVVLLDGLYGNEDDFEAWVDDAGKHRLFLVGSDTASRVERFVAGKGNVERAPLPMAPTSGRVGATARLVYLKSEVGHMELVTEGRTIPEVLRLMLPRFDPG